VNTTPILERLLVELRKKRTLPRARLVLALYRWCIFEGLDVGDEARNAYEDFADVLRRRRENRRLSRHFGGIGLVGWGRVYRMERYTSCSNSYLGSNTVRSSSTLLAEQLLNGLAQDGRTGCYTTFEVLATP